MILECSVNASWHDHYTLLCCNYSKHPRIPADPHLPTKNPPSWNQPHSGIAFGDSAPCIISQPKGKLGLPMSFS